MPRIAVATVLVLLLSTALWAQEENPDLKSGKISVKNMMILAPSVKIVKKGVKGTEEMIEESHQYENALRSLVLSVLSEHQCTIDDGPISDRAQESNPDLKFAVADLQKQFDEMLPQLEKKSKDVREGRFTLGDDIAKINPGGVVDALVFIRGAGQVSTGGKVVLTALATHQHAFSGVVYHIAVVDARSGVVLYYGNGLWRGNPLKDTAEPTKAIRKLFKRFPEKPAATAQLTQVASNPVPSATPAVTVAVQSREENWLLCRKIDNPDISIGACTALIQAGHEKSDDLANAFTTRGFDYFSKSQYDNAIADYDEAIRLKPDYFYAFNNRGTAYYKKGQYDRAIQDYDQAIRLKPDFANAISNRASAYSQKGQTSP